MDTSNPFDSPAVGPAVGTATPTPAVAQLLATTLERSGRVVAIVNHAGDLVHWWTTAFESRFPGVRAAPRWSTLVQEHALFASLSPARVHALLDAQQRVCNVVTTSADNRPTTVSATPLDTVHMAIEIDAGSADVTDIHAYLRAQEGLFSTSRSISVSEMATTLAHEINQPVGTIINLLRGIDSRLRRTGTSSEAIHQAIGRALDQAGFTAKVITRIRDFTDARRPRRDKLDTRTVMTEAIGLVDWLQKASKCSLHLDLPDAGAYVAGDATMLQQVFVNLLRNAIEAMAGTPVAMRHLVVRITRDDSRVKVTIRDNGTGLDGDGADLFVPFATTKANGMGVGLNICRSFVELHQGRLWLSPNADRGCTAHVVLPQAADNDVAESERQR